MALTFQQLITPITVDQAEEICLAILKLAGFPVTAWQPTSVPRRLVRLVAEIYAESRSGVAGLALSQILDFASGDALAARVRSFFEIGRAPAVSTRGVVRLIEDGGGPYTISAGGLKFLSDNNLIFTNTTGGELLVGGTLDVAVVAESAGSAYNVPVGAIQQFQGTPLAGVDVQNPAIGATGTWITTAGANEQSDASLRLAAKTKWAALGAGAAPAYISWALTGAATLTRVRVFDDNPNGPGTVKVVLANEAGGASANEVVAANAIVQALRPLGIGGVEVVGASNLLIAPVATVFVRSAYASGAAAAIASAVTEYTGSAEIGGKVYRSKLTDLLHYDKTAVRNVSLTSPPTDTMLTNVQVPTFDTSGITIQIAA